MTTSKKLVLAAFATSSLTLFASAESWSGRELGQAAHALSDAVRTRLSNAHSVTMSGITVRRGTPANGASARAYFGNANVPFSCSGAAVSCAIVGTPTIPPAGTVTPGFWGARQLAQAAEAATVEVRQKRDVNEYDAIVMIELFRLSSGDEARGVVTIQGRPQMNVYCHKHGSAIDCHDTDARR